MRSAGLRWPARAVAVWAVLAGLFLMHGAASPAGGCCGSTPVTAMTVTAVTGMPAMPAAPAGASYPGDVRSPAGTAPAAWHASPAAASPAHGAGGGTLCSARQPRSGGVTAGPCALPAASAAAWTVAAAVPAAVTDRAARPPGKAGLPLPLFLGVSRT